jgi:hypothetical protein
MIDSPRSGRQPDRDLTIHNQPQTRRLKNKRSNRKGGLPADGGRMPDPPPRRQHVMILHADETQPPDSTLCFGSDAQEVPDDSVQSRKRGGGAFTRGVQLSRFMMHAICRRWNQEAASASLEHSWLSRRGSTTREVPGLDTEWRLGAPDLRYVRTGPRQTASYRNEGSATGTKVSVHSTHLAS